jgi:hypothetical protein
MNGISMAVNLLLALLNNSAAISALIQSATAQNRDITIDELKALLDGDALLRAKVLIDIDTAQKAGK